MRTRKPKEYKVTVVRSPRTPEEDIRIRQEITDVLYRAKMESLRKQAEQAAKEEAERKQKEKE